MNKDEYRKVTCSVIAPTKWLIESTMQDFEKNCILSIAAKELDSFLHKRPLSHETVKFFKGIRTVILFTPEGYWFRRSGFAVDDILVNTFFNEILRI